MMQANHDIETVEAARLNRRALHERGVLGVLLAGDAGTGKTRLLEETLRRFGDGVRSGVVVANPKADRDAQRLSAAGAAEWVVPVRTAEFDAAQLRNVLEHNRLGRLDVLFIETVAGVARAESPDLGQDLRAAVFSVSGGDDKAAELPRGVADADLVLLTKADLFPHVQFDVGVFESDVRRLNVDAPLLQVSAADGTGMQQWERWLLEHLERVPRGPAAERIEPPECYLG